jgi:dihydroceramidase
MYLVFMGGRSGDEKKKLLKAFGKSIGFLAVGYTLWQIDLEKCIELRQLKQALGLPWAWVFELHGWWHVLTALGASQYVRLIRELEP